LQAPFRPPPPVEFEEANAALFGTGQQCTVGFRTQGNALFDFDERKSIAHGHVAEGESPPRLLGPCLQRKTRNFVRYELRGYLKKLCHSSLRFTQCR
jgi:hypothetical protein